MRAQVLMTVAEMELVAEALSAFRDGYALQLSDEEKATAAALEARLLDEALALRKESAGLDVGVAAQLPLPLP